MYNLCSKLGSRQFGKNYKKEHHCYTGNIETNCVELNADNIVKLHEKIKRDLRSA